MKPRIYSKRAKSIVGSVFGLCSLLTYQEAHAFCRQMTCEPVTCTRRSPPGCVDRVCETDDRGCITEGVPLFYEEKCLKFGVDKGAASYVGLSDEELEGIIAHAFERWEEIDCGGGKHPGFYVQSAGIVETNGNFFCQELPELNLSVWTMSDDWQYDGLSLGYTTSTFGVDDGRIYDADVEFNVVHILDRFPPDALGQVMLAIATHEAGHFLGLAHSDVSEAVMAAAYSDTALLSRDFHQDDIEAICTVFPPLDDKLNCSKPGVSDAALTDEACQEAWSTPPQQSCAVSAPGVNSGRWQRLLFGVSLLLFGASMRIRSRRLSLRA